MSEIGNPALNEKIHFVTLKLSGIFSANDNTPGIFEQREFCDDFVTCLINSIDELAFKLYGFVILTDQVYLITGSYDQELEEKIEVLKDRSAMTIIHSLSKKLSKSDHVKSREHPNFRRIISQFLNSKTISVWQDNELYTQLYFKNDHIDMQPLTSKLLSSHLADGERNYLQLGASAFTKLMMENMKI